ncbi:MAG: hypothetical protein O7C75_02995, partial [Verrucomicrobia bacterium]|nr:hypothetical protein [Verrucomicrobiota bacterium]
LRGYQLESSGNQHAEYYADKSLDSFPGGAIHPWLYPNRQYFGNPVAIRRYAEELSAINDVVGAVMEKLNELAVAHSTSSRRPDFACSDGSGESPWTVR